MTELPERQDYPFRQQGVVRSFPDTYTNDGRGTRIFFGIALIKD
jgi:hypothetical protein